MVGGHHSYWELYDRVTALGGLRTTVLEFRPKGKKIPVVKPGKREKPVSEAVEDRRLAEGKAYAQVWFGEAGGWLALTNSFAQGKTSCSRRKGK